ncbi:MAG: mucoidy inhibitor MuiA family protein [Bacteroidota bacterium]
MRYVMFMLFSIGMLANNPIEPKLTKTAATVFLDGAQITAETQFQLKKGSNKIVIRNLSTQVDANSIQVSGLEEHLSLQSIQFKIDYLKEVENTAKIESLEAQIDQLKDKIARLHSKRDGLDNEESLLQQNKNNLLANEAIDINKFKAYAAYYNSRTEAIENALYDVKKQITENNTSLQEYQNELRKIKQPKSEHRGEIHFKIYSEKNSNAKLEIAYMVRDAGWYPSYELRASNIDAPISFLYKANVYQHTGEDWSDIDLKLSTGDPSLRQDPPVISPLFLNFNQRNQTYQNNKYSHLSYNPNVKEVRGRVQDQSGLPLPGVDVSVIGQNRGTQTDFDGKYSISVGNGKAIRFNYLGFSAEEIPIHSSQMNITMQEDTGNLDEVIVSAYRSSEKVVEDAEAAPPARVERQEAFTTIVFTLPGKQQVASTTEATAFEIDQQDLEAEFNYYAAPVLDTKAYLKATLKNWEDLDIYPGEASIYFEGTYAGTTFLNPDTVDEELKISLGADPSIAIERNRLDDTKGKNFFGSNRIVARAYEIKVKNNKNKPITVKIEDRIPVSRDKEIKVSEIEYGAAEMNENTGILTWEFDVQPAENKTNSFSFEVKYPKDKQVNLGF